MSAGARFVMTEAQHAELREHLFPGDGLEAAAIVICTRSVGKCVKLIARSIICVPHDACDRQRDFLRWPGNCLEQAIGEGERSGSSIMLIHSHPGGFLGFSELDDYSDQITMPALFAGVEVMHGSAVMIPDGTITARLYDESQRPVAVELISVVGDDIQFYFQGGVGTSKAAMAFTGDMTSVLSKLSVAVIGVSGTGSVVAEQLARLGFGEIILIDHDRVEPKNLNRILNSTIADAESSTFKVDMFADAIGRVRGDGVGRAVTKSVGTREAVFAAADADVLFSCVDTKLARMIADRLASRFIMPLFDVGVLIPTMKTESAGISIAGVYGRIDYVKPGGASLFDREVYTSESLRAESLQAANPEAYEQQLQHGYIQGVHEEAPAVIALNMLAASTCVMEFLARVFRIREEPSSSYARTMIKFSEAEHDYTAEKNFRLTSDLGFALGPAEPLLGIADWGGSPDA